MTVQWRWRWTVSFYAVVWLLFVIAIGSAGLLRHTTWLIADPEPMYQVARGGWRQLSNGQLLLHELLIENDWDLNTTREAFMRSKLPGGQRTLAPEEFQVVFYPGASNRVAACVMIPRRATPSKPGFALLLEDDFRVKSTSELNKTIEALNARYLSKAGN